MANSSFSEAQPVPPTLKVMSSIPKHMRKVITSPKSMPSSPTTPMYTPPRRRLRSEDLHLKMRRFAPHVDISFHLNEETQRRELDIEVRFGSRTYATSIELRKLIFWSMILLFCVSQAGAFKLPMGGNPAAHAAARSPRFVEGIATSAPLLGGDKMKVAEGLVEDMAEDLAWDVAAQAPKKLAGSSNPLVAEVGQQVADNIGMTIGKMGAADINLDSDGQWDVSVLSSSFLVTLVKGELTKEQIASLFSRACISAATHKVIGSAFGAASTAASCIVQGTGHS